MSAKLQQAITRLLREYIVKGFVLDDEDATIWSAYAQLQTYKAEIPTLPIPVLSGILPSSGRLNLPEASV